MSRELQLPEVVPPGWITLRFAAGPSLSFVVDAVSLPALERLFRWQVWTAGAPPLVAVEVVDSTGLRYWQNVSQGR